MAKEITENKMREVSLEKITVNICVGNDKNRYGKSRETT
jgi:ribosomal protein L5